MGKTKVRKLTEIDIRMSVLRSVTVVIAVVRANRSDMKNGKGREPFPVSITAPDYTSFVSAGTFFLAIKL